MNKNIKIAAIVIGIGAITYFLLKKPKADATIASTTEDDLNADGIGRLVSRSTENEASTANLSKTEKDYRAKIDRLAKELVDAKSKLAQCQSSSKGAMSVKQRGNLFGK